MKKILILCLLAFGFASAVEKSLAIMPCQGEFEQKGLEELRKKVQEVAVGVSRSYPDSISIIPYEELMKDEKVVEELVKATCKEGGVCYGDILRDKIKADYGVWCAVSNYGKLKLRIQLHNVSKGKLDYDVEYDTYNPKNYDDLVAIIKTEAPGAIAETVLGIKKSKSKRPAINAGIGEVQVAGDDDEEFDGKTYLVNISTEPSGAVLSFDGVPNGKCPKTPCKLGLEEGKVRIIASLEQYEVADTNVTISQNNQAINMRLKENFGVLEIKPAYEDGIGKSEVWNFTINGKAYSFLENRLDPGNYSVGLSHRCYEDINFKTGIVKGKREVFDVATHMKLKKGRLVLNAEQNGELVVAPVFLNGKQAGETIFDEKVPVCSVIEVGEKHKRVNVALRPNEKVEHTEVFETESIDTGIKPMERAKKPGKLAFWAGIGLEVVGATLFYVGYTKNKDYDKMYDEYKGLEDGLDSGVYGSAWKKADDAKSSRNLFYIIGGVSFAAGIPLWVF